MMHMNGENLFRSDELTALEQRLVRAGLEAAAHPQPVPQPMAGFQVWLQDWLTEQPLRTEQGDTIAIALPMGAPVPVPNDLIELPEPLGARFGPLMVMGRRFDFSRPESFWLLVKSPQRAGRDRE